jgi:hypothetical protein
LDRDEQADLDASRVGEFSLPEIRAFEAFCANLERLAELHGVETDGVCRAHPCSQCSRTVPAGIPVGWRRSKWDLCPACVRARRLVTGWDDAGKRVEGATDKELNEAVPGDARAEMARFFSNVKRIGAK